MGGDLPIAMEEVHQVAPSLHLNPLTNEAEGDGVAVGRQAHEIILGHDPRHPRLLLEAALSGQRYQLPAFSLKPRDRGLMGRAVQATVGDGRRPFVELGLEVHHIDKCPPRQKVPLHIFDTGFDSRQTL